MLIETDGFGPSGDDRFLRRTAQEIVAERLRLDILSGRLAPGTRLLQAEVAKTMRMSTTPVREAIRELASEGLLDLDPHRGVIVHEPHRDELRHVYEIRMLLEPECIARTVERIREPGVAEAEQFVLAMDREADPGQWTVLNNRFHALLADASGNPLLAAILKNLRNRASIYVAVSMGQSPDAMAARNAEHRKLLEACRNRDPQLAVEVTLAHLESTVDLGEIYLRRLEAGRAS